MAENDKKVEDSNVEEVKTEESNATETVETNEESTDVDALSAEEHEEEVVEEEEDHRSLENDIVRKEIEQAGIKIHDDLFKLLADENGAFKENANRTIFSNLNYYKPTSVEEINRMPKVPAGFVEAYGEQALAIIRENVEKIEHNHTFMKRIEPEFRDVLELLIYRNNTLNAENKMLHREDVKKNPYELSLEKDMDEMVKEVFPHIYVKSQKKMVVEFFGQIKETKNLIKHADLVLHDEMINKLYISVGTIKGKLKSKYDEADIDAPLLFIPVNLEYPEDDNPEDHIYMSYDRSRTFEMNIDVILLNNKIHEVNTHIDNAAFHEIQSLKTFDLVELQKHIHDFYVDNGVDVDGDDLKLEYEMHIGMYDVYKNPTQVDFEWILEHGFITENIYKLVSKAEDESVLAELKGEVDQEAENRKKELIQNNEYEVSFITKLNFPQDNAIKGSKTHDNIVIQGPPGTGKTETITSIISDAVLRGKKVLVSSEKLVAIDVIKSRLEDLAKYTILYNNTFDSAAFYDQINFMLTEAIKERSVQATSSSIASDKEILFNRQTARNEIIDIIKQYQTVFNYLNSNEIGQKYAWLYKNHASYRTTTPEVDAILEKSRVVDIIKQHRLFVPRLYDILLGLSQKFSAQKDITEFDKEKQMLQNYPWLPDATKPKLSFKIMDKAVIKFTKFTEEDIFNDKHAFTGKALGVLKTVFIDPKPLARFLTSRAEILNMLTYLKTKCANIEGIVDSSDQENVLQTLGLAWQQTFDAIKRTYVVNNRQFDRDLASKVLLDHTVRKVLELKETSSVELQKTISNGSISTFNQVISKLLQDIVDHNVTLTGRHLRDKIIDTLVESGKLAEIQSITENQKSFNIKEFMDIYWKEIFEAVDVWLLPSNNVPDFFPLVPEMFDIVIIDEASQMQVEKSIPLLYRAKKLIISGDDKQIKPSVKKEEIVYYDESKIEWKEALLPPLGLQDALKNKFPNYLLNYHYRSRYSELIGFSNSFIYNNSLYTSTPKAYDLDKPPVEFHKVKNGKNVKGKNNAEAKLLVELATNQILTDPEKTLGLVAFTEEQAQEIRDVLAEQATKVPELDLFIRTNAYSGTGEDTSLFVKAIDEVQGDERDQIYFSITYAKDADGNVPENFGIISRDNGENILNVAITRSKEKIVVVSSLDPNDVTVPSTDIGGGLLKQFLYYADAFATKDPNTLRRILKLKLAPAQKVFESKMHEEIYHLIEDAGYTVDYQFGFDDYKIDFVIKNDIGEIVLGIDIDNNQYLRNFNTMEREYYIPTYLSARGWKIIKIWSHQWAKDPDGENESILQKIETALNSFGSTDVVSLFSRKERIMDVEKTKEVNLGSMGKGLHSASSLSDAGDANIADLDFSHAKSEEEREWLKGLARIEQRKQAIPADEFGMYIGDLMKTIEDRNKTMETELAEIKEIIALTSDAPLTREFDIAIPTFEPEYSGETEIEEISEEVEVAPAPKPKATTAKKPTTTKTTTAKKPATTKAKEPAKK